MEASAKLRFVRMSPQKGRLIADMVRGKKVGDALNMLHFTNTKPAKIIEKLLKSARANAEEKNVGDPDAMIIKTILVDKGPVMKRQLPRARGRVDVLHKPFSHITLILESHEEEGAKRKAPPAKKGVVKKGAEVKTEKKSEAVKGEAEKAPAKKATVKKTSTKKPVAKKTADAKKGTAKKAAAKKAVAKKTVAKKSAAKKTTAKKSAKKK